MFMPINRLLPEIPEQNEPKLNAAAVLQETVEIASKLFKKGR